MFIDGLSSNVVNSETFSTIMPNTAKYFENGFYTISVPSEISYAYMEVYLDSNPYSTLFLVNYSDYNNNLVIKGSSAPAFKN